MCEYFYGDIYWLLCPFVDGQYGCFILTLRIGVAEDAPVADAAARVSMVAIWGTQTLATPPGQRVRVSRKPRFMLDANTASLKRPL